MILNELTNEDAIEAAKEEAWQEAQQQMIALIDQGLSGEQLKQALQREPLRTVFPAAKTESSL
jgi:hypothetical protein